MMRWTRPWLVACIAGLAASPAWVPAPARAGERVDDDDFIASTAWVKFKLTHDGKTHAHPGYLASAHEEMIQTMGPHEVSIVVDHSDEGQWSARVTYKVAGKKVVGGARDLSTKKWTTFKSADGTSTVQLHVDPDATDAGDDITLGKGRRPLDGLK